jgi:hypothetical protein
MTGEAALAAFRISSLNARTWVTRRSGTPKTGMK